MGEGASIFGELPSAQGAYIFNSLYRRAALVRGKFLVAENGKAFFQAKLKPVAAGNAVARPIVEIFMGDNGFNPFEIHIGRALAIGQKERGVKDVKTLIFHRAKVKIAHSHNHEAVQIIFASKSLFIPFHGANKAIHGIFGARGITGINIDR